MLGTSLYLGGVVVDTSSRRRIHALDAAHTPQLLDNDCKVVAHRPQYYPSIDCYWAGTVPNPRHVQIESSHQGA